jgi:GNAT superfamily N-acetyltransferase
MEQRSGLEMANDNAATLWLAMAGVRGWETRTAPGYTAVRCEGDPGDSHRVVLTRPPADARALTRELLSLFRDWETGGLCLEDPYGVLELSGHGCERSLGMPVMVRPAGPVEPRLPAAGTPTAGPDAVRVVEALAEEELAAHERVVVQGFPVPARMPLRRGRMFPAALSAVTGRRSWLARRQGEAAGACVSWDDGSAVGLYWVAVLERHRSHGVARALLEAALGAQPGRAATLTATLLGEPLYRRLGFVEQGVTTWWHYPGTAVR